jgi:hypothetical protein
MFVLLRVVTSRVRRRASLGSIAVALLIACSISPVARSQIIWESGTIDGQVDNGTGIAAGTFTFDAGDRDCDGVDYSAVASPGSPGTWSVTFALPGPENSWSGAFQASSGGGSLAFGSTTGTYLRGFPSLFLEGPITFSTTGSVPPLPAALTAPAMQGVAAVLNDTGATYDFSGLFQLTADGVAAPNAQATAEGNEGNYYPLGILVGSIRYQQVYAASEFGCPGGPRDITAISFRPDEFAVPISYTLPFAEIRLSTTSGAPDALIPVFADNVGIDDELVYSGSLTVSTAATGGPPGDFDVVIPLDAPFQYDPTQGNLLLDVTIPTAGPVSTLYFDAENSAADPVSRVWAANSEATVGSTDTRGLVTKFSFHFPSPLILDYGEVDGTRLPSGDVLIEGVGVSATASRPIFDITPYNTNWRSLRLTGTLGTGSLGPLTISSPLTKNILPLPGHLRLCLFLPVGCEQPDGAIGLPFTENGVKGVGIGGTLGLHRLNENRRWPIRISLEAAPWTSWTATVPGIETAAGGTVASTYPRFRHGPASFETTASEPSGVIQFVTPGRIIGQDLGGLKPIPVFNVVRVRFVPEPGSLVLICAGALGIFVMGRRRTRG